MAPPEQVAMSMEVAQTPVKRALCKERLCFTGFGVGMMLLMVVVEDWQVTVALLGIPPGWATMARAVAATGALGIAVMSCVSFLRTR